MARDSRWEIPDGFDQGPTADLSVKRIKKASEAEPAESQGNKQSNGINIRSCRKAEPALLDAHGANNSFMTGRNYQVMGPRLARFQFLLTLF